MQSSPQTWRELLGSLNEQERKVIVERLGIQTKTLDRWVRGATELPRISTLQHLLPLLPNPMRKHFMSLLQQDTHFAKYISVLRLPNVQKEIPAPFYTRILEINASNSGSVRFTAVCQLAALQIIQLLDPDLLGLCVTILKCSPPSQDGTIKSLRQHFSLGTHPWSTLVNQTSFFLGAESIVARAITQKNPFVQQDIRSERTREKLLTHQDEHTTSVAALRLRRETLLGGVLVVASTQPHFFTENTQTLLQQYSNLLVVALKDDDFYSQQQIDLGRMPPIPVQQNAIRQIYRRVVEEVKRFPPEEYLERWSTIERAMLQTIEMELLTTNTHA